MCRCVTASFPGLTLCRARVRSSCISCWTRMPLPLKNCGLPPARCMNWRWPGTSTSLPAICCCWTGAMWTLPGSTPCSKTASALSPGSREISATRCCRTIPYLLAPRCWPIKSSSLAPPIAASRYPETLRLVHYRDPETGKEYVFLTNLPDLPALAVADLYRQRWQIETFFRWIKQNLKIKAFYGTSENAVLIQIWTAMIAYLLLLWIKLRSRLGWSILELTRLVQNLLMERCNLWALLCPRTSDPTDHCQLTFFNLGGAC